MMQYKDNMKKKSIVTRVHNVKGGNPLRIFLFCCSNMKSDEQGIVWQKKKFNVEGISVFVLYR